MTSSRRNRAFAVIAVVAGIAAIVVIIVLTTRDNGSGSTAGRRPLAGFGETHVSVKTSASTLAWCLLLAATQSQHNRGLMQVTDPALGGYDGMVFRFDGETESNFYMRNTPMPLSIAFVASNGEVLSTTDMAPCEDRDGCPLYGAPAPYHLAIEVPQGQLGRLGIQPGANVVDDARPC